MAKDRGEGATQCPVAKLRAPAVRGLARRPALSRLLDAPGAPPAYWLAAPGGAGKTSLLATHAHRARRQVLWYRVDPRDADPANVFYYLRLAAAHLAPERPVLPLLTPEYAPGARAFAHGFFEGLLERLGPGALMIFDGIDQAGDGALLGQALAVAIDGLLPGQRLLMAGRTAPPPALARARTEGRLGFLGWDRLRLDEADARRIAAARGLSARGRGLTVEAVHRLHRRADGWAAALVLLLEQASAGGEVPDPAGTAREVLFDYLATEFLEACSVPVREFLFRSAPLERFTADMAAVVTGTPDAAGLLERLLRGNHLLSRTEASEPVYDYHGLYREFLLERGRQWLGDSAHAALLRRAAEVTEAAGQADAAVDLLLRARDWPALGVLVSREAPALASQGRLGTLESWLGELPEAHVSCDPWLRYWRGMCLQMRAPRAARQDLAAAFEAFRARGERGGLLLAWSGVVDSFVFQQDEVIGLDAWIDVLESDFPTPPELPSPELALRVAASAFVALLFRRPWHPDLPFWRDRVRGLLPGAQDTATRLTAAGHLLVAHALTGEQAEAASLLEELRPEAGGARRSPLSVIFWYTYGALHRWLTAHFDGCMEWVEAGRALADESGVHLMDGLLLSQGVHGALGAGDTARAEAYLGQVAERLDPSRRLDVGHYHYLRGWAALLAGRPEEAYRHALRSREMHQQCGLPFIGCITGLALAHCLCALGRPDEADALVAEGAHMAERTGSRLLAFQAGLLRTRIDYDRGHDAAGQAALAHALTLGRQMGYQHYAWWEPDMMGVLCRRALAAGIEAQYVTALVRVHGLVPDPPPVAEAAWPWAVRVHTLGRFALVRDGRSVTFRGKAQKRPLELLKVLLALGGRGVSEERVADTLWPDAEGDVGTQALATTVHRLRRLVGDEVVVRSGGELSLDARRCWVDAWAFRRLADDAEAAAVAGDLDQARSLSAQALDLYQGPFLARDPDRPWALPLREKLRQRALAHVERMARRLCDARACTGALEAYRKGLEIDGLTETFHRGLMHCHHCLGQTGEALAAYERCRRTFATALGVEPSPETRRLMHDIRGAGQGE